MPRRRDKDLLEQIGRRVAQVRKGKGFSQEALAERIGIQPVTLSRLETGDRGLSLSSLAVIAEALEVTLGDLVDTGRMLPEAAHAPDEAELVSAYSGLSRARQKLVVKLVRELAG